MKGMLVLDRYKAPEFDRWSVREQFGPGGRRPLRPRRWAGVALRRRLPRRAAGDDLAIGACSSTR
jgi:hypothetical protein